MKIVFFSFYFPPDLSAGSFRSIALTKSLSAKLDKENEIHILPITEIITENDFFDFSAKYEGQSQEITPAEISENWKRELSNLSEIIFKKLGLSGFIRSEFIMVNDVPHLLEINSVPGMTKKSIIPQQVEKLNIKLTDFITRILKETIKI